MSKTEQGVRIDLLQGKHESLTFSDMAEYELTKEGERLKLLLPGFLMDFDVVQSCVVHDLLVVIGRQQQTYRGAPLGLVLVARRTAPQTFLVHVWHETFPSALEDLGLHQPAVPTMEKGSNDFN